MKKCFTFFILLITLNSFAQKEVESFEIHPAGINGYVVLEFPEMSSPEIFNQLKKWAEYNIRNAGYSNYSEVENEFLTYSLIIPRVFSESFMGTAYWNMEMDAIYRIKDGRLRIDVENISFPGETDNAQTFQINGNSFAAAFYTNSGKERKVHREKRIDAEKALKEFVSSVRNAVAGKPDIEGDDW